ncbi:MULTISPECIES: GntR family transcriptional regulator [Thermoactinomyces]|jgi:GntR family transcriptional regulator|uniref:GntR family transcriptional regulator n=1 Tax=Thermoactinomyces daqus TaxID=1329516 RepID=A0A7W1X9G8_9BACL|nr:MULTISPECIES: GntR family transcriptional regulator [Thermoactinomyces]MBA4542497.1 GntR family transcriptional regulator [Thermoactinomyces daqus]MBH8598103.1 GntR family transcriptional regulator [Thermoactinomyces sp. CICC 10523]MBH8603134.1 GntR family transcriptional regulator [Thermoactinomyces sp. CICC 10522]MBH8607059.1 GntR family transcriptional regulator [Thermoactinomyces sp. CICC 10521]
MKIIISQTGDQPIYAQIAVQIKHQIFNGILQSGDALPSIRKLAKELKVSVITTKRAYEELEKEALIRTVAGKGTFVTAHDQFFLHEKRVEELKEKLGPAIREAKEIGLSLQEVTALVETIFREEAP